MRRGTARPSREIVLYVRAPPKPEIHFVFPTFVGPAEGSEDLAVLGGPVSICLNFLASICLSRAAVVLLLLA